LRARANFVARAEKVRKMNSERPPDNQVSKIAVDGLDHLYRISRPYRDAQDRVLWRDKTCPARI